MKYFCVLGNNPALSIAELNSVLNLLSPKLFGEVLIWENKEDLNINNLMFRLGGAIKIGWIKKETNSAHLSRDIIEIIKLKQKNIKTKFNFGISNYSNYQFPIRKLGLNIKKRFSKEKISSRFVVSKEKTLSSVVVGQNKMTKKGVEIVIIGDKTKLFIGETIVVQPFKLLSKRDYGRPFRDDHSGMLPPKLAQIMINLAQIENYDSVILDPFCGSGTILSELVFQGYNNIMGSDLSLEAIQNTRNNIKWLEEKFNLDHVRVKLVVKDVSKLSQFIKTKSVDVIVTEPYLGPQRGKIEIKEVIDNLEKLYSQALEEFYKVLKDKGRIVMIWPVFYGNKLIKPDYSKFKIVNVFPEQLKNESIQLSFRNTIIYGRKGQKVYREIVVLEKD